MINGISSISDRYNNFIFDIWGVLHNGLAPFSGTIDCLRNLKDNGKEILLLSNTPDRHFVVEGDLAHMGIDADLYDHILTAGDSAHEEIKTYHGQTCWYAGSKHGSSLIGGIDLNIKDHPQDANFIINDLYKLNEREKQGVKPLLEEARDKNLLMICGNPDLVVGVGDQVNECPGTYALIYEQLGGKVSYHGKPHQPIYQRAWEMLGTPDKSSIVAVGDSLHTDIQGANNFGIDSVFNLEGIHRREVMSGADVDVVKLEDMIKAQEHRPDMVLNGFGW